MNKEFEEYFKWMMWKLFAGATLWAGYIQGMDWCVMVFNIYTYCAVVMSIILCCVLGFFRKIMYDDSLGRTKTVAFHSEHGHKKLGWKYALHTVVNGGIIATLAHIGEHKFAWIWVMITAMSWVMFHLIHGIIKKAGEIAARPHTPTRAEELLERMENRERRNAAWDTEDTSDDTFDDNDLFRMGIEDDR
jgi:hypothetical protein